MEYLFPLLLVALLVPMFLAMRRQKREMQSTAEMQALLTVGNRVLMTCGVQGIIVEVDADTVDVEIAVDVVTTWSRAAVKEVIEEDAYGDESSDTAATEATDTVVKDAADATDQDTSAGSEPRLNKD
ncbi:preprotein translocase subunit YajC [Antrihabitans stalactiti]|uniref:Preprotein translocase subunit YajC n=1 Tax=Antrihabitans stalactiti TaxID=2584121 RepID=A0A848K8B6_9NOCA|nr:preprotein translocase subunit YajC [Antrihabitans stalactiti]NMN93638.1 preprotein translocase subunit YajC [Antrihabitans stalactiti]